MSLERAIHRRWASYRPLVDLVSADRFRTQTLPAEGGQPMEAPPYVTLERLDGTRGQGIIRTSGQRTLAAQGVRFNIWAGDLDVAKRIRQAIADRYSRQHFGAGGVIVQDMKLLQRDDSEGDDGLWHLTDDYLVRTETTE